ncbi:MBL fold metallo-hydrolase [Salinimonas sp. HHU 13199]|uniref:MBL fold metallo-hydrolase n=1 Tax=Salinimonas profundi TaxID=2729140 RepID=A0ABR8LJB9_9ALTE|nr:MBL fold metallo-hydrolase [Salinimonas profundi]MBD3586304.1 MBL fold metallo-hydrolase [Salinimonas profundi]
MSNYPGLSALLLLLSFSGSICAASDSQYQVEKIKDNVFRFTSGKYHSAFMITRSGAFVTDPIDAQSASYLRRYIKEKFDVPVSYMAYSHNHVDHTAGGQNLKAADTIVVAQSEAAKNIVNTQLPTALPDVTFSDELTIKLDESQVKLQYYGRNNGYGSVSMRFEPANVLFVVDWITLNRLPYKNLKGYDIEGMIASTEAVLNEPPFDVFIGGHADIGTREDVESYLGYLRALYNGVETRMRQGHSLQSIQKSLLLSKFSHLKMFKEWREQNIEGVYNTLNSMSYYDMRQDIPSSSEAN